MVPDASAAARQPDRADEADRRPAVGRTKEPEVIAGNLRLMTIAKFKNQKGQDMKDRDIKIKKGCIVDGLLLSLRLALLARALRRLGLKRRAV